ncbi:MAG: type IV pilus twitching motility protein PilT [Gemmatimonadales bacterium]
MARLDRFLQAMVDNKAQGLLLAPGKPVSLLFEAGPRPVTKDPIAAAQVLALAGELLPPGDQARLSGGAPTTFSYAAPTGPVAVEVIPEDDGTRVIIRPDGAAPAPARPAAPPAAAAPAPAATVSRDLSGARAMIETLLRKTVELKGSDLHLRTGEQPIIRRDGELVRQEGQVLDAETIDNMMVSIMSTPDQSLFRETGDADWAHEVADVARFRCNAAQERRGPMGVFRVIPSQIRTAEELGLSSEIQKLCYLTKGLVLVTGPTGSGKSTTLAGMIDLVNRTRTDHILTIEDPIEFVHPPRKCVVTQRQVGQHSRSFKTALRAALREDPDIIMVGEMRDLETVSIAIETAETGHLVFGTLHTTTAASTIDRIIDQFPVDRQSQVRVMLAESLKGVIAQVLCRRIGGGRVAAKEVLLSIPAVSNLIREGKTFQIPSIMQTNRKTGMVLLNDALLELVEQKLVEPKEAYMRAVEKSTFAAALKAKRFDTSFLGESSA